jgi:hypothetical protein
MATITASLDLTYHPLGASSSASHGTFISRACTKRAAACMLLKGLPLPGWLLLATLRYTLASMNRLSAAA